MSAHNRSHGLHRAHFRYPITLRERLYAILLSPLIVVVFAALMFRFFPPAPLAAETLTIPTILLATFYTTIRIVAAYGLSIVVALPLALLAERSRIFEAILLPVFDVLQSIPNLALLPILVLFFVHVSFLDGAAIVLLFLNMVWNIVFALVGGLQVIPHDVKDAARIFGLSGWNYVRRLIMPAIFPQFVTGSILAFAGGWNIIIVAEALHVYIAGGTASQDLFGIGAVLFDASGAGQSHTYLVAFSVMVIVIALFNFFVWQRLLHLSQRFRFD